MLQASGLMSDSTKDDQVLDPYKHISSKVCTFNDTLLSEIKFFNKMANPDTAAQNNLNNTDVFALLA